MKSRERNFLLCASAFKLIGFSLTATTALNCAGFQHPPAQPVVPANASINEVMQAQAQYCTSQHDELNNTLALDILWWGSLLTGAGTMAVVGLAAGVGLAPLVGIANQDPSLATKLAAVESGAVIASTASWLTFAFANDRRESITRAQRTLLDVRDVLDGLQESQILGLLDSERLQGMHGLGRRCYEIAADLKAESEGQTLAFAKGLARDVTTKTNEVVKHFEQDKLDFAKGFAASQELAQVKRAEKLKKVDELSSIAVTPEAIGVIKELPNDIQVAVQDLSVKLRSGAIDTAEAKRLLQQLVAEGRANYEGASPSTGLEGIREVPIGRLCLLGFQRVDGQEIIIPPRSRLRLTLKPARPGADVTTYSLIEAGADVAAVELGTGSTAKHEFVVEPAEVPRSMLIGDAQHGTSGPKSVLDFPVGNIPATQDVSIAAGSDAYLTFKWECPNR